jgi:hypothetical protein
MRLEVPFYKQTSELGCGPTALKMVFSFFGEDLHIGVIEEKAEVSKVNSVSTVQLAIASAKLGFKTKFYSTSVLFNEEHNKLDFYKKYNLVDLECSKKLVEEAKGLDVDVQERSIPFKELISFVSKDSLPIVLLDWNVVKGVDKSYLGHFVPVVGYDERNVYVHNQGFENPTAFLPIERSIFDKARKAKGTDEDIVTVYRKK